MARQDRERRGRGMIWGVSINNRNYSQEDPGYRPVRELDRGLSPRFFLAFFDSLDQRGTGLSSQS